MIKTIYKWLGFVPEAMRVKTEVIAGMTTFLTMSYILVVNPDILSAAGMDKGAVFTATALSAALATILLAVLAKLPLAQAPGMGLNAFFAYTLVGAMGYSWQTALAAVFVEGIIFILLTVFNIRDKVVNCIPLNLRYAISVGIGMFIAFVGLKNAGIVVADPATFVRLGAFTSASVLGAVGVLISGALMWWKVKGALFYSIMICTVIGIPLGITVIPENFSLIAEPQSLAPTFLQFDFASLLNLDMVIVVILLVFMDMFDTIGMLVGVAAQTGMMTKDGCVLRMKEALMADAVGTSFGAALGASTVTTYAESAAGIAEGGRSGMTALVCGVLFLLSLFLSPLFLLVPGVATTGALVVVGVLMISIISKVEMTDISETLPVFVTIIMMVLTYSIAEGMALGMLSYTCMKLFTGQFRVISPTLWVLSVLFILRYIWE